VIKNLNDPQEPAIETGIGAVVLPAPADADLLAPAPQPAPATPSLPLRFSCFVTGTDTEIGKTLVASAILHKLVASGQRACGMKPVAAGATRIDGVLHNDDAAMLAAAGNVHLPQHLTTPYMLGAACAPHIAAALEGVTIELVPILAAYADLLAASDAVVVEGVGGFRVPFSDTFDSADLATELNLPVILVVGMRLGCISHALLTVEAIVARNLVLAGWVANTADPQMAYFDENLQALAARIPAPLLGVVPRLAQPDAAHAARFIDLAGLPGWPSTRLP
jgi:dethiobiotin synthetase